VVATTSRDTLQNNSNTVTSAESVMMLKEHIIETLGEIRYTMSMGASGASILQNLIANAYPGLLDGIQPFATLADLWTTNTEAQDCSLLLRYFTSTAPLLWGDAVQQNTVMDNANDLPGTCRAMTSAPYSVDIGWMSPTSTSSFANVVGGGPESAAVDVRPGDESDGCAQHASGLPSGDIREAAGGRFRESTV
jgi:hypothetical protein